MKLRLIPGVFLASLAAIVSCGPSGSVGGGTGVSPVSPDGRDARPTLSPAVATAPVLSRVIYEDLLDELLPGIGAANVTERRRPQQDFEQLCFLAGRPGAEDERRLLCEAIGARLGSAVSLPARVWLLRQLERFSGEESVVLLDCLLLDEEPQVRELARRCLLANPSPRAGEALRVAFDQTEDADWRIALANSLGVRRDAKAIPPMIALVYNDRYEPTPVAVAVTMALGEIAGSDAQHWLTYFWLGGAPDILRPAIADALLRCAELDLREGRPEAALTTYEMLIGYTGPEHIRLAALRGLVEGRGAEALPTLLSFIMDDQASAAMRAWAATLAAELPGFAATATLAAKLPEASESARVMVLQALADRADPAALPAVIAQLGDDSGEVRVATLRALGVLGDRSVALTLAQAAAGTSDEAERDVARRSLARLRGDGVDDVIRAALADAGEGRGWHRRLAGVPRRARRPPHPLAGLSSELRVELIVALKDRWCWPAVPALLEQASDESDTVRMAAYEALGALAPPDAAITLVELLVKAAADAEEVRQAAENAAAAVCGRIEDESRRATPVLAAWEGAPPTVQASLLRVLGRVGGAAALERIRAARSSTDAEVADAAVRALAGWSTADVLDDLFALARDGDDLTHRVLALQGYVRLLGLPGERPAATTIELYQSAMKLAERPEERRLVLGGLGSVRHLEALRAVEQYLSDSELRAEAEAATVSVASLIGPLDRDEARAAIQRIIDETATDATRRRGEKALADLRKSEGRIVHWLVTGPYEQEGQTWSWVFDHPWPPEQPDVAGVEWRPLDTTNPDKPWNFDLLTLPQPLPEREGSYGNCCAYVRSAVWSPEQREVRLEVGSDDAVKAWLSGQLVHQARATRGHTPFQDKVAVTLEAGWNTLMLKVVQASGDWALSCAVRATDGEPPEGLRFEATPTP